MREWNNTSKSETPRLIYRNKIESCDHTRRKIVDRKEFFTAPVALKSCLDRRRNSMTSAGQGFVKKLLFPSFADAGANDAFRGGDSNAGSEAIKTLPRHRVHGLCGIANNDYVRRGRWLERA